MVYEHMLMCRVHILPLRSFIDPLDLAHLQKQSKVSSFTTVAKAKHQALKHHSITLATTTFQKKLLYYLAVLDTLNLEYRADTESHAIRALTLRTPKSGPVHAVHYFVSHGDIFICRKPRLITQI